MSLFPRTLAGPFSSYGQAEMLPGTLLAEPYFVAGRRSRRILGRVRATFSHKAKAEAFLRAAKRELWRIKKVNFLVSRAS